MAVAFEQHRLLGFDPLSHEGLGELVEFLLTAAILEFTEAVAVTFLGGVKFPHEGLLGTNFERASNIGLLLTQEGLQFGLVSEPVAPQRADPLLTSLGRFHRVQLARQHEPLEVVVHFDQSVALDPQDGRNHFVVEGLTEFVDAGDGVVEDHQGIEPGTVECGQRPAEHAITGWIVQLAAQQGRHRLPHDRVPEPHKNLMLPESHDAATVLVLLDEGGVEHEFHTICAGADRERLPSKPFPARRRLEAVESGVAGDRFERGLPFNL